MGLEVSDVIANLRRRSEWKTAQDPRGARRGDARSVSRRCRACPRASRSRSSCAWTSWCPGSRRDRDQDLRRRPRRPREEGRGSRACPSARSAARPTSMSRRSGGTAYLEVDIDRDRIARYGINVADVQAIIETAIGGNEATRVSRGRKSFGMVARFPEWQRSDVEPIQGNPDRRAEAARGCRSASSRRSSSRKGRRRSAARTAQRRIVIECNVTDRDMGSFVAEARAKDRRRREAPARLLRHLGRSVREPAAGHAAFHDRRAADDHADLHTALHQLQLSEAGCAHHPEHSVRPDPSQPQTTS